MDISSLKRHLSLQHPSIVLTSQETNEIQTGKRSDDSNQAINTRFD